ncbi:GNAT family N-acetyltransferase [Clostridium amazonitimonense]|uniref:GNAT family N-acetyltransferase n=1 Tax=Clostridium amazonitimonense TaxID=1499689 RepID=UPI0005A7B1A8|nr:GNAT family N-acetyltransferase [Clostridium amazonitimonense]
MSKILNLTPSEEDILKIRRKLQDYNSKFFEIKDEPNFTISEIDEDKELLGGIVCTIVGQWLEIDFLWIKDEQRGKGLGKKLLHEAEKIGIENKCNMAFLTTMNFQAEPFYLKHGYKTVYVQKGYPITNEKYFMEKELKLN